MAEKEYWPPISLKIQLHKTNPYKEGEEKAVKFQKYLENKSRLNLKPLNATHQMCVTLRHARQTFFFIFLSACLTHDLVPRTTKIICSITKLCIRQPEGKYRTKWLADNSQKYTPHAVPALPKAPCIQLRHHTIHLYTKQWQRYHTTVPQSNLNRKQFTTSTYTMTHALLSRILLTNSVLPHRNICHIASQSIEP